MTREEAIEILKELWRYERTMRFSENQIREALEIAVSALKMQKAERWIPVSDPLNNLPKDRHLLVTVEAYVWNSEKCRYVTELYYDMTEWSDINEAKNAIAYMSYPEPYRAESEDKE